MSREVAGPGFINFRLKPAAKLGIVQRILAEGENFGKAKSANKEKVQVEFVSANPTGPLHVGHGRQAALGDAIAALLEAQGHAVTREFYYNDAGAQIDKLALVGAGAREGAQARPARLARGRLCAASTSKTSAREVRRPERPRCRSANRAVAYLRKEQDADLQAFGVKFDVYYLESSLYTDGKVDATVKALTRQRQDLREGRRAVAAHHRLRRRQGPRGAQVRRQLHLLRAGRRLPRHEVGARLPQGDQRAGHRSPQHGDARARRPAGARASASPRAIPTTCCTAWSK